MCVSVRVVEPWDAVAELRAAARFTIGGGSRVTVAHTAQWASALAQRSLVSSLPVATRAPRAQNPQVPMDNGGVEIIMAHRVQHNNSRGPYKGGFKYHPEADLADTEA
jgi:glutamate dehydrogenase/leucine dehydrogenase